MIEWTYKVSKTLVGKNEQLWSAVEERYVPVGSGMIHLLVSINDETYSWLNKRGLFHARVGDSERRTGAFADDQIFPRVCKLTYNHDKLEP